MKQLITIFAFFGGSIIFNGILAPTSTSIINSEGVSSASIRLSNNDISNNTSGIVIAGRVFFNGSTTPPNGAPALPVQ